MSCVVLVTFFIFQNISYNLTLNTMLLNSKMLLSLAISLSATYHQGNIFEDPRVSEAQYIASLILSIHLRVHVSITYGVFASAGHTNALYL